MQMAKVSTFDQNVVIHSSQGDGKIKVDSGMQYDTEKFFRYIFSYLSELEKALANNELSLQEILRLGRQVIFDENQGEMLSDDSI